MSQNEWKTTEIRGFKKLGIAHPFPAQVGLPDRGSVARLDGCTAIDGAWLAQLGGTFATFSEPLEQPPPRLKADGATVSVFRAPRLRPTKGPKWALPVVAAPLAHCGPNQVTLVLAKLLLKGDLLPGLVDASALLYAHDAALPLFTVDGKAPKPRMPRVDALLAALEGVRAPADLQAKLAASSRARDALANLAKPDRRADLQRRLAQLASS